MGNHTDTAVAVLTEFLTRNPHATINDCCRELVRAKVAISKPLAAKLRKNIMRAIRDAVATVDVAKKAGLPPNTLVKLKIAVPPGFSETNFNKAAEEKARAEAKERDEERERKWQTRAAEREREWAEERERDSAARAQAAIITSDAPPRSMNERAIEFIAEHGLPPPEEPARVPVPVPVPVRRGAANRALRRQYLNELLDADPGADPLTVASAVKSRFGIGLDWGYIYDTCRVAREVHKLPQIRSHVYGERSEHERPGLPEFEATGEERAAGANPEEDVAWLMRQLRDVMRAHGLASMTIAASEAGASWEFTEKPREPRKASGEVKFS